MASSMRVKLFSKLLQNCHESSIYGGVWAIFKRDAHKVNIKNPRPGSLERQILVHVTKPILPVIEKNPAEACTRRSSLPNSREHANEYEQFLIRRMREKIEVGSQGLMVFCMQTSCSSKVHRKILVNLHKNDFSLSRINRKVFYHCIKDTKYQSLETMLGFSTVMIHHELPLVSVLMSKLKKMPELHVLCGVVDDRLLSKTQLEEYSQLPDKQTLLGQTCALLGQPSQRISSLLTSQQEQLVRNLDTYIKDAGEKDA